LQALPPPPTSSNTTTTNSTNRTTSGNQTNSSSQINGTSNGSAIVYPNQPPTNLSPGFVVCTSCATGFIVDSALSVCRQNCSAAQLFNYTLMQC